MPRKSLRIALVLPRAHDYAARLIEGVLGAVKDRSRYEFIEVPYDEGVTPSAVYSIDVQAALVWTHPANSWVLDLKQRGATVVSFNSEWLAAGIPCVGMDVEASVEAAVEHLARLHRQHAAYIGHLMSQSVAKQRQGKMFLERGRLRGWTTAAFEVSGVPSDERERLANPSREKALLAFIKQLPKPAVAFCDDDYVASLFCRVAEHLGLSVPGDLAVLGYFDMMIARFSTPTISSLPGSGQAVGEKGMRLLEDLLAGKQAPRNLVMVPPPPIVERESTGGTTIRDDDIRRVHDMIGRLACQGLTVDHLLTRVSMSQKTLNKRYAAVYGLTPGAAIRKTRAERAKELLATTSISVSRIADMVGFDEPSNFNLFFKREVGCTPGQYRAEPQR